ncbi:hypothetical protein SDJN02_24115, partial [Cucurbita argyrosperma subsp. argyrosperma]
MVMGPKSKWQVRSKWTGAQRYSLSPGPEYDNGRSGFHWRHKELKRMAGNGTESPNDVISTMLKAENKIIEKRAFTSPINCTHPDV